MRARTEFPPSLVLRGVGVGGCKLPKTGREGAFRTSIRSSHRWPAAAMWAMQNNGTEQALRRQMLADESWAHGGSVALLSTFEIFLSFH